MRQVLYIVGGLSDGLLKKDSSAIKSLYRNLASNELVTQAWDVRLHDYSSDKSPNKANPSGAHASIQCGLPWLSSKPPSVHSANLLQAINELSLDPANGDSLVVVAYSAGSAIFLDCLATALEEDDKCKTSKWTKCLKNHIHLAGMTLGWQFNSEMNKTFLVVGPLLRVTPWLRKQLTPFQFYKGSDFITNMRIRLARQRCKLEDSKRQPEMVYLLGTKDMYLSPADAIEPGFNANAKYSPTYYEIPGSGHTDILCSSHVCNFICKTLNEKSHPIDNAIKEIPPDHLDDYLDPLDNQPPTSNKAVKNVVIILHGIRDNGYWAKRIGHRIKSAWPKYYNKFNPKAKTIPDMRTVSLSYGYFSLWDFIRPGGRSQAVQWFQNVYADIVSLYPNAAISFIGHSNGTYLGTHALNCPAVRFKLMLLAGSVVRRDFWNNNEHLLEKIDYFLNIRAVQDWVVGLFPAGCEAWGPLGRPMDLGGAGAYGFHKRTEKLRSKINEINIYGDHGAGIAEKEWDNLANYICHIHADNSDECTTDKHNSAANANDHLRNLEPHIGRKVLGDRTGNRAKLTNGIYWIIRPAGGALIALAFALYFLPLLFSSLAWLGLAQVLTPALGTGELAYPIMTCLILLSMISKAFLKRV